jgi:monoamine oxidase
MTVKQFLEMNFDRSKHEQLIISVRKFVEGYDSADYSRASAMALKDEWLKEDDDQQYHIAGGYETIYLHLRQKLETASGKILLNSIVNKINWSEKGCAVFTGNKKFEADKVLVTVPTGVLADENGKGFIAFEPRIPELDNWIQKSGYGAIIKVIIEFTVPFWQHAVYEEKNVRQTDDIMFLFTDMKIPTWWTQLPDKYPLLTGWLSGPDAFRMKDSTDEEIMDLALSSLCEVYSITKSDLLKIIKTSHIKNWTADPFTKGAYSYITPETKSALEKMNKPFGKLFFAGEAFSDSENGTVEAAFFSAIKAVELMENGE